jgi:pimeloyl-ACP methyl ester carboxylesterase/uncharacterized protein (DUF362 family)
MQSVVAEFTAWLAANAERHSGDPEGELAALWQVALEREAMVTLAYRRDIIELRMSHMPLSDDVRAAVARAIHWAWRDEEAHTLVVRGHLIGQGRMATLGALRTQLEGRIGGWTASRQHHLRWGEAPIRRFAAEVLEVAGAMTGRVPAAVRTGLRFSSFREVCAFNVDAERTAELAWSRMSMLARASGWPEAEADQFEAIAADEDRHARLFGLLAAAFDDADRLAPGWDGARLEAEIAGVGQRFLAFPVAGDPAWGNPLGKGGVVRVVRSPSSDGVDRLDSLDSLVADALAELLPIVRPGVRVAVKTSFMLITRRDDPSPGVSVAVLRAVVAAMASRGAVVSVLEAGNLYDRFYHRRSVREVADWLGLGDLDIVDAQDDQVPHAYRRGLAVASVCRAWKDAEIRVVLGKLRSHPTSRVMLGLEASEGLAARHDAFLFGDRRAERATAMMMVLDAFPPHFAVIDAWDHVPDGLLGMFGGAETLAPRRLYAGRDLVAVDAVVARHAGIEALDADMALTTAVDWFGDPRGRSTVDGDDAPIAGWRPPDHDLRTSLLAAVARPVFTWASVRGALFLPDFDEVFTPIGPPSGAMSAARAAVRSVVDDARLPTVHLLPTAMLPVCGRMVRVARVGAGRETVVLLHGYPETLQLFAKLATHLSATHSVIAFDWPGLGASEPWPGGARPEDLADQLVAVLDASGVARAHLVGSDMGGQPALVAASRHPDRVASVTVMNSLLFGDGETSWEIAVMRRTGLSLAAFHLVPGLVYQRCISTFLEDGETLSAELDADFFAAFSRRGVRDRLVRMCRDYDTSLPDLPGEYWAIRAPVRLVWASDDKHFPLGQAERFRRLRPETHLEVIEGAQHWMVVNHADRVAAFVLRSVEEAAWTS